MTEAEEAASHWDARVIRHLKLRENEVHEIAGPFGRAALRLHRPGYQTRQAILSELWWCRALAQGGLPVPLPLTTPQGAEIATLRSGRFASVVSWIDGSPIGEAGVPLALDRRDQIDSHRAIGRLIARVHALTDTLALPDWFERPRWDLDGLVGERPFWGRFWEHPALDEKDRDIQLQARAWLTQRLKTTASPSGLVHADVLRENIFRDGPSLSLIDFDDSGFGYRWYDLGTVLSQNLYEPHYQEIRAALIEGYQEVLPLAEDEVDAFTLARTLASVGWAAPRLPPESPIHRSHIARAVMFAKRCLKTP